MRLVDLVEAVARPRGVTKKLAAAVIRRIFALIAADAMNGKRTAIPGFGVFSRKSYKRRTVIQNGVSYELPRSVRLGFRPSKNQKHAVKR